MTEIRNPFDGTTSKVAKAEKTRDVTMGNNVRYVSTPKGVTGASGKGLQLKHVRGKNTSPRRTQSQHFTNSSATDRRVKSLKVVR